MEQQPLGSWDLNGLQNFLQDKKYDKYPWVKKFLEQLIQVRAERSSEISSNIVQQHLNELSSSKPLEIEKIDRQAIIGVFHKFSKISWSKLHDVNSKASTVYVGGSKSLSIPVQGLAQQSTKDKDMRSSPTTENEDEGPMETENNPESSNSGCDGKRLGDSELLIKRTQELQELQRENSDLLRQVSSLQNEGKEKQKIVDKFEAKANEHYGEIQTLTAEKEQKIAELNEVVGKYQELFTENEHNKKRIVSVEEHYRALERKSNERIKTLSSERDDLRNRYSKLAGQKLKDNNSDISDLSDPNRPMKLGIKFSELYDNEWTDVFQAQVDILKKTEKDAIQHLLGVLDDCYGRCKQIAEQQMDMLRNVFLYHCQDVTKPVVGGKDKPRLHSNELKALLEARKGIASNHSDEVKQLVVPLLHKRLDKTDQKIQTEFIAYFEKCVEVCWLLAVNDPPLYMDMEVKAGGKVDTNLYTSYYTPGDKTDFLVWPPLYNVHKGGLINKGVIAPVVEKKKIKK